MSIPGTFLASTAAHCCDLTWHHVIVSIKKFLVLDLWLFHSVHHCTFYLNPEMKKKTSCISFICTLQGHKSTLTFITIMLLIQSTVLHVNGQKKPNTFLPLVHVTINIYMQNDNSLRKTRFAVHPSICFTFAATCLQLKKPSL